MTYSDNQYTMGIKDIAIRRAGTTITFPASQAMKVSPMVVGGTLRGSGKIVAANSYIEGAEIEFGFGGWPLAAFPIIFGIAAPAASGSTPNRTTEFAIPASSALPYFEAIGRTQDGSGGDVHVYLPQCKIMSAFDLSIQDGANFVAPSIKATAIPDAGGMPFYFISNETTAAVSASLPAGSSKSISALAVSAGIATATSTAHGFGVGQWVTIAGATEQGELINGLKQVISVADANTFTFLAIGATNDASVSGTIVANY